jgi:chromosome segregation ATPase
MSVNNDSTKHTEGSPWFWKIFGGTAVSIIVVLLLAYTNNITSNIDKSFLALKGEIKDLSLIVDQQKERILNLEKTLQQKNEKLANFEQIINSIQSDIGKSKQEMVVLTTNIETIKEEIKKILDNHKETSASIQNIREKIITMQTQTKNKE